MTSPPSQLSDAFEAVRQQCSAWAQEARSARQAAHGSVPAKGAPAVRVYEALLDVRGYLDRLEGLLDNAMALRGSTARRSRDAADEAEDAWGRKSAELARLAGRRPEFSTGRERASEASLATFEYQRTARQFARIAELAAETETRIRLLHRGLDSTRQDLVAVLRYLGFESNLERT